MKDAHQAVESIIRADLYTFQNRTSQSHGKGDVTTNGPARNHSQGAAAAGPKKKWGWI